MSVLEHTPVIAPTNNMVTLFPVTTEVDGLAVEFSFAKFAGTFDVEESDARYLALDEEVMFVVKARVKAVNVGTTSAGDVKRVNTLGVTGAAVVRSPQMRGTLASTLGLETG